MGIFKELKICINILTIKKVNYKHEAINKTNKLVSLEMFPSSDCEEDPNRQDASVYYPQRQRECNRQSNNLTELFFP